MLSYAERMSDEHDAPDQTEREAILARRKRFVSRTLDGVEVIRGDAATRAGRRTKLAALAIGGLAVACPCLNVAPPETSEEGEGPTPDMPDESNTSTGTGGDTGTGTSTSEDSGAGAAPEPDRDEAEQP